VFIVSVLVKLVEYLHIHFLLQVVQLQMGSFCTLVIIRKLCNMILVTLMKVSSFWV